MRLSLKWLNELVDLRDVDVKTLMHRLTMSGSKVETLEKLDEEISSVAVGRILSVEKHPDADKLSICRVDVGSEELQIVTAATNVFPGALVPVALDGARLAGGVKIKSGKLRGALSQGMFCSFAELGLTRHECPYGAEDGILILPKGEPGEDVTKLLGMDDSAIEFEITPNRPDCCSILGLAREAAATFDRPLNAAEPVAPAGEGDVSEYLSGVSIEAPDLCKRYMARAVTDVRIEPSPEWLRMRLWAQGIRAINNIVDITNYVMLEYGQPMHAFDHACLSGSRICVRRAADGETMNTLDGKPRELNSSMLVIADADKPVAVAGVMGGENSEITDSTRTVVFESACFDGASIRLTSKALGMRTDSSSLFEKYLPPENCAAALDRACELVEQLGAGKVVGGKIDVYPDPRPVRTIKPDYGRINVLLGTGIPDREMDGYFARVGLEKQADGSLAIPYWRDDVACTADLAEEVARFYGYDNIPTTTFAGDAKPVVRTPEQQLREALSDAAAGFGFDEILTFTFFSPKTYDKILMPADSPLRKSLSILNPLGGDESVMRTTALPSLLNAVASNQKVKVKAARLFEIAKVFSPALTPDGAVDAAAIPTESYRFMLAEYGEKADFYSLKGVLDAIFTAQFGAAGEYAALRDDSAFHPGRTAVVSVNGVTLGVVGEISGAVSEQFGFQSRVYAADLDVGAMLRLERGTAVYRPISKYPALYRDIAVICRESVTVGALSACIRRAGGKLCREVDLFDVYRGIPIAPGEKSVAFSIVFADDNGTVTDEQADKRFAAIVRALGEECGARLR
ncbi:MAG: phenylalanine--tRNA ligase subunit beta [Oscillospiraceae bacterium]|nr:phenylalanine--tRNA ligase subunit beta [Oscillospiraceae bacterium]